MDASGPPVHEAGPASRTDAALLVVDEHGRVSGWSHGAAELFGLNSEDALGRPASALFTSAVPEVTPGSEWRGVLPVRGPHGSTKDVPFFGYAVPSHGGEPQLLLVDRNEQSVPPRSHTEALSEWLFSGSPVAMALYDPELRCVRQSSALQKLTGVPEGDRIGEGLSAVLSGADVAQCEQRMRRVLRTGLPDIDFTVRGRTPADSDHDHSFSVSVARLEGENGRVLGVCTTVLDTTEQLRGEGRLALLNEASIRIGSTLDVMRTGQELADVAVPSFADFVTVDLLEILLSGDEPPPGPLRGPVELRRVAQQSVVVGAPESVVAVGDVDTYPPDSPPARCLADGRPALHRVLDPAIDSWIAADPRRAAKIREFGFHSWIIVPVRARGVTLGVVLFGRSRSDEPFEEVDLSLAEELVARAAVCLDNARRFTRERAASLTLQRSLLPHNLPASVSSTTDAAFRYLPAARTGVGGDWFDVIPLSGARVALVVGDVVGHGLHAAAAMGRLRTAVRTLADVDLAPDELLTQLDDLVIGLAEEADAENASAHVLSDIGATCLYAVYDPVSGTCTAARAGHPAPALVQPDGEVRFLDLPTGPPLGVGGLPFETSETALPPGSVLALFTDGLIESRETDLDVRLEQLRLSLSAPAPSLEALCDHVVETLLPEYHSDDAALLMVRAHGLDEGQVASWRVPAEPEAVGKVRRDVARRLADWDLEELGFTTELAVSELVTNAIRYGGDPIGLRLILDRTLICEISDGSSTAPHLRRARAMDEGGRGLMLVARTTQRWGSRQTTTGKIIWCEQKLPEGRA